MSRTSDETLGRRRFQLLREQAVEDALEKVRHAPAAEWQSFSPADYTRLRDILGELWIHVEREKWKLYCFSRITRQDIREILELGANVEGSSFPHGILLKMDEILSRSLCPPE